MEMSDASEEEIMTTTTTNNFFLVATGCVTVVLVSALFVVQRELSKRKSLPADGDDGEPHEEKAVAVDKSKHPGGLIKIFYATQTGTAESFAQQLEREAPDHGFVVHVKDMEDAEIEHFLDHKDEDSGTSRVVILSATYGEGEPTDNSTAFVQTLKELAEDKENNTQTTFNGMEYCVFGLGNRQYEHYNAMGKLFDEKLDQFGGSRIMELGLGDDDNDLEGDFETWKDKMWVTLKSKYVKGGSFQAPVTDTHKLPDCEFEIEYHAKGTPAKNYSLDQVHGSSKPYFTSFDCPVSTIRELRSPEDGGSTVHVEIDISKEKDLVYETADNLGVLATNTEEVVKSVAESLGYDLNAVFSLKAAPGHEWHGAPFPMPITVKECLTRYVDLTDAPRRSDLKQLAQYAKDPIDRKALERLASKDGKKEYKEKITEEYVGVVDILKLCPSLTIPLEHFVSMCRHMMPRFYTIASSSSKHPDTVHLTVAVTEHKKKDGAIFKGLCSNHLAVVKPGSQTLRVFNRPSTFRLPKDSSRPILMIGPGTGIAPMRALLQERRHQQLVEKKSVGKNVLYFGCKKSNLDYLYQDEIQLFQEEGVLTDLHVAFSREQKEKVYVQHLLSKNAEDTYNLIDKEHASIYVCGGVKMGHDVTEALKEIMSTQGGMSFDEAKDYLAKLASDGRFVQELWA